MRFIRPTLIIILLIGFTTWLAACGGGDGGGGSDDSAPLFQDEISGVSVGGGGSDDSARLVQDDISRVSVGSAGVEGNSNSFRPSISGDGRFVAFGSRASNLVVGDTNGSDDIFVHDTVTATTTRVSVGSAGVEGNNSSFRPSISGDGRYVAFGSRASNLVAVDTNGSDDIFRAPNRP